MNQSRKRLAVLLLLISLAGCVLHCPTKPVLCCLNYEPDTNKVFYCNNHRDAANKFIRAADSDSQMIARWNDFKQFFNSVMDCTTVVCIEAQINADTTLPGFRQLYETEHGWAEDETNIDDPRLKAELILCGFRHAILAFEQTMKQ
jgi:hypothetical protein